MKKTFVNWLGFLGVVAFLSYLAAVVFSPLAYPDYNRLSQAVSDLSASDAPSRVLWGQLSALYDVCGVLCVTLVCIFVKCKLNKNIRIGIYLFTAMTWLSAVGYKMFPLSSSGNGGTFQDIMHVYVVTIFVVLLSIASLVMIMIGGYRDKKHRLLAIFATIALIIMLIGAIGTNAVPKEYFGIFERFSTFAAVGFTAVLGIFLFLDFEIKKKVIISEIEQ